MLKVKQEIWLGDCLEKMYDIPDRSIDAVIADIPYGTTACSWDSVIPFEPMWKHLHRVVKPNGAIVLFGSEPFSSALRMSNIKNYKYDWYWDKQTSGSWVLAKIRPLAVVETISVFSKNKIIYNPVMVKRKLENKRGYRPPTKTNEIVKIASGVRRQSDSYNEDLKYPQNIIRISNQSNECNQTVRLHPTQKPVALIEYLVKTYTNENELVLDFTAGSGTTGEACVNTNRQFILIEKGKKYYNISVDRIKKARKNKKLEMFPESVFLYDEEDDDV